MDGAKVGVENQLLTVGTACFECCSVSKLAQHRAKGPTIYPRHRESAAIDNLVDVDPGLRFGCLASRP